MPEIWDEIYFVSCLSLTAFIRAAFGRLSIKTGYNKNTDLFAESIPFKNFGGEKEKNKRHWNWNSNILHFACRIGENDMLDKDQKQRQMQKQSQRPMNVIISNMNRIQFGVQIISIYSRKLFANGICWCSVRVAHTSYLILHTIIYCIHLFIHPLDTLIKNVHLAYLILAWKDTVADDITPSCESNTLYENNKGHNCTVSCDTWTVIDKYKYGGSFRCNDSRLKFLCVVCCVLRLCTTYNDVIVGSQSHQFKHNKY